MMIFSIFYPQIKEGRDEDGTIVGQIVQFYKGL